MTREEAVEIKGEMLKKEGTLILGDRTILDGLVMLNDMLDIINKHINRKEQPCRKSSDIKNSFLVIDNDDNRDCVDDWA